MAPLLIYFCQPGLLSQIVPNSQNSASNWEPDTQTHDPLGDASQWHRKYHLYTYNFKFNKTQKAQHILRQLELPQSCEAWSAIAENRQLWNMQRRRWPSRSKQTWVKGTHHHSGRTFVRNMTSWSLVVFIRARESTPDMNTNPLICLTCMSHEIKPPRE